MGVEHESVIDSTQLVDSVSPQERQEQPKTQEQRVRVQIRTKLGAHMATAFRKLDVEQLKREIAEKFEMIRTEEKTGGEKPPAASFDERAARLIEVALRHTR